MGNKRSIKSLCINLILLFIVCLLLLVVLEIILRIYSPFEFRVKGDKIILPVNISYKIKNDNVKGLDPIIVHKKNSIGFRGDDPPKDFINRLSLITVGGSTTECFFNSDGKTWTDILGKKLKYNFDRLWINNAGISGQSTFGHVVLMEDYIKKIRPKIVLFLIGSNDRVTFSASNYDKNMMKTNINANNLSYLIRSLTKYSELFSTVLNIYRYYKARTSELLPAVTDFRTVEIADYSAEEESEIREDFRNINYEPFRERLIKLIKISRENDIEPIFITQPALFGNAIDDITNVDLSKVKLANMNGRLLWENYQILYDSMKRISKEEGVFLIDLALEMPKSSEYYFDFLHYTNEGAEKIAGIIYEKLCPYIAENYSEYLINNCTGPTSPDIN